jgi:hypothetical protein
MTEINTENNTEVTNEASAEVPAENTSEVTTETNTADKKSNNDDMLKRIKQQNPGVKIIKNKNGGFQISNPRAPSPLLTNLLKRATK